MQAARGSQLGRAWGGTSGGYYRESGVGGSNPPESREAIIVCGYQGRKWRGGQNGCSILVFYIKMINDIDCNCNYNGGGTTLGTT